MAFKREQFSWIIESVRRRGYQYVMKMSIVITPKKGVDSADFNMKE
jgi:DNA-binding winged helix-turn-helix (wHTH) protein